MNLEKLREAAKEYEDIYWIRKNEYRPATIDIFINPEYDTKEMTEFLEQNIVYGVKYNIIDRVPCYDCPARTLDPNIPDYLICLMDRHHAVTETNLYIECPKRIRILDDE